MDRERGDGGFLGGNRNRNDFTISIRILRRSGSGSTRGILFEGNSANWPGWVSTKLWVLFFWGEIAVERELCGSIM